MNINETLLIELQENFSGLRKMIETIEAALFYTGAGSLTLSGVLFIGGITWNKVQARRNLMELPVFQDLPRGTY